MPSNEDLYGLDGQSMDDLTRVVSWFFNSGLDKRLGGSFTDQMPRGFGDGGSTYVGPFAVTENVDEEWTITINEGYVNAGRTSWFIEETDLVIEIADDQPWYVYAETLHDGSDWSTELKVSQTRPTQDDVDVEPFVETGEYSPAERVILAKLVIQFEELTPDESYILDIEQWWQAGDLFVYNRLVV